MAKGRDKVLLTENELLECLESALDGAKGK